MNGLDRSSSESARVTTAPESRFRIDAANSLPRAITVIALDAASAAIVRQLARRPWNHADFLVAAASTPALDAAQSRPLQGWISDLAGRSRRVVDEIGAADVVVVVATPGGDATAAQVIGEACRRKGVMTTALIVGRAGASEDSLSETLAQLRPYASMLVIADTEEYVADMLAALRA
jgi:hypothetical protein